MLEKSVLNNFVNALKLEGFNGNIHTDISTLLINATDNSIYELLPSLVLQPKNKLDIIIIFTVANLKEFLEISFVAKGGGTSTNAQSLTTDVVIDLSYYFTNIIDLDLENLTVTVESGVVLSTLNEYLKSYGVFFAPHVSTANRATIGGMIANDSAGKGSLVYGKTSDHLIELTCILSSGTEILVPSHLDCEKINTNFTIGQIAKNIYELLQPINFEIEKVYKTIKRPLSGYNLRALFENNLNLTKIIAGSEGTLAIVTDAKLKLSKLPKFSSLIVIHYNSFIEALQDAKKLIQFKPSVIETIDENIQNNAMQLPNWPYIAKLLGLVDNKVLVSNFIEFSFENLDTQKDILAKFEDFLKTHNKHYKIIDSIKDIKELWKLRASAVGLAANVASFEKPVAFVEDTLINPEYLAEFVTDFKQLLDSEHLKYAMYGHIDVGCLHVRPLLNLQLENERKKIRNITEKLLPIIDKYDGFLWGEHGKGIRGEFLKHLVGENLYIVLEKIKAIFDPNNRLNPHKLVKAYATSMNIYKIDEITMRGALDSIIPIKLQQEFESAMICNGNAECFNQDKINIMCPSYKITHDRVHSPKGRAMLIKEWLRKSANFGFHAKQTQDIAKATFLALQGCLGCHGCSGNCPTQVSIPDIKSKFLNYYYKLYAVRDLRSRILANSENFIIFIAKFPKLWNLLVKLMPQKIFKISNLFMFKEMRSLNKQLQAVNVQLIKSYESKIQELDNPVVIIADVFSGILKPQVLIACCTILKYFKCTPVVLSPRISGKSFLVLGDLIKFKKYAADNIKIFEQFIADKVPLICLENSIYMTFANDYPNYFNNFKNNIIPIAKFILTIQNMGIVNISNQKQQEYILLPHCTEQVMLPANSIDWQEIFKLFNIKLHVLNVGCCGMAGMYGHYTENQKNSALLFNLNWKKHINTHDINTYLATGYSCISQTEKILNNSLKHPLEILAHTIKHYKLT